MEMLNFGARKTERYDYEEIEEISPDPAGIRKFNFIYAKSFIVIVILAFGFISIGVIYEYMTIIEQKVISAVEFFFYHWLRMIRLMSIRHKTEKENDF